MLSLYRSLSSHLPLALFVLGVMSVPIFAFAQATNLPISSVCRNATTEFNCNNAIITYCNPIIPRQPCLDRLQGALAAGEWAPTPPPAPAAPAAGAGGGAGGDVNLQNLGNNPALDISIANPFIVNGSPITTVEGAILQLLNLLIVIVTPLIALAIIFAGFKYVTARGNPSQISDAHKAITYAIIGGVLVLGAVTLSQVLQSTIEAFRVK